MSVLPKLNINQLITFYFIAREKSFSAAADVLCLSQPAVTLQIKSLESSAGVKLVHVSKKRVNLTHAGETVFRYAEEIYRYSKTVDRFLETYRTGSLHVGTTMNCSRIVASVAAQLEEFFPNLELTIKSGHSREIVSELVDLEHDLAIVPLTEYSYARLKVIKLGKITLQPVMSKSHTICNRSERRLADLAKELKLFLPSSGTVTRDIITKKLSQLNVKFLIAGETNDLNCVMKWLEGERSMAFSYSFNLRGLMREKKLKIVKCSDTIEIELVALATHDKLSGLERKFISLLSNQLKIEAK